MYLTPTKETYDALDRAFHFFNERLFDNRLPAPMILLQRKRGAHGYFWAEQFQNRDETERLDEIALNPQTMGRTIPEVLSTLVHEMTHLEQHHFGTPGKSGNHNKEWGTLMDRVGLEPTSTGQPGGKRTGRKVTHMIVPGGPFDAACSELIAAGYALPWFTNPAPALGRKQDLSKVKHTCPCCSTNAWGKLGINLICGDCDERMVSAMEDEN